MLPGLLMPYVLAQDPCADDARKFCPGKTSGTGEFLQCMRTHRHELLAGCKDFMREKEERQGGAPERNSGSQKSAEGASAEGARRAGGISFIDTHSHLDGKRPYGKADYAGAVETALKRMDKLGISKGIVMPPPMPDNFPANYECEDFLPALKKHADRFAFLCGGGSLNVMIQQAVALGKTPDSLRSRFKERAGKIAAAGAAGFGEMTAEHLSLAPRHPYEAAPPDHPLFLLLADIAAERGLVIDLHMEALVKDAPLPARLKNRHNPGSLRENISALERLLAHNRKTRIVWAHAGWDNTGDRTPELCRKLLGRNPNLYMSLKIEEISLARTSPVADGRVRPEWLELLKEFPDRFVFGTDQFYSSPRVPFAWPGRGKEIRSLLDQLPAELARKIAVDNVLRIYPLAWKKL